MGVTDIQRAQYARAAGFPENQIAMAVAVSIAENTAGDPSATHKNSNGSVDYGLWQINSIHNFPTSQLFSPQGNANAAFKVWTDAGNSWKPWSTYPGKAMVYFQRGQFAARDKTVPNPGGGPTVTVDLPDPLQGIADFAKFISDEHNWVRVGWFLAGAFLLTYAFFTIDAVGNATKKAAKVAVGVAVVK
jgi:hypothetical protein